MFQVLLDKISHERNQSTADIILKRGLLTCKLISLSCPQVLWCLVTFLHLWNLAGWQRQDNQSKVPQKKKFLNKNCSQKFQKVFLVFFSSQRQWQKQEQLKKNHKFRKLFEGHKIKENKFNFRHIAQFVIYNPTSHHHRINRKVSQ